ncbi:carbohydrate ABC transporter permease [Haloplanus halophilus]|uniref:carbohydrate ABC transporter permease n=1 Tax=Haloplanus halophilus TaxID=2949993 RepID=UPI00203D7AC2|nr:carbohydrate ABC transporter permease [Haloplanus sp. GDY1]
MVFTDRVSNRIQSFVGGILPYQERLQVRKAALYLVVILTCAVMMFPMYWMLVASIQPYDHIVQTPTWFPTQVIAALQIDAYISVFADRNFERWYFNSVLVAIIAIVSTVGASTLAGYGLTRVQFRGRKNFARLILFSYMFPPILLAFPQYQIWRQIGLLNSYIGISVAHIAISLPFGMWMMWKFFQTVPIAYEEAAWMNGASQFHSFKDVAIPMAKPGMVAVAIFTFAVSWNDFTMATILLPDSSMQTLPPAVQTFVQQNYVYWGQIMAASTLMSIPPFLLVYKLQESILEGFRTGGL